MKKRFGIYSARDVQMWIPTLAQLAERRTVDVIDFLRSLVRLRQVGSFFIQKEKKEQQCKINRRRDMKRRKKRKKERKKERKK